VIHKHDINTQTEKGEGKSIPESEDNIKENIQKVLDQSIRKSPVALNTIIPPRIELLINQPKMSATTTASTKTVGFTLMTPASSPFKNITNHMRMSK
jgi:hypothetical protein